MSILKKRRVNRNWNKEWKKIHFSLKERMIILNVLSAVRPHQKKKAKLKRHFFSKHKSDDEKYPLESQSRTEKFDLLQKGLTQQQLVFKEQTKKAEALTVASSIESWEIVRHMKPLIDGEFIKNCTSIIKTAAHLFSDKPNIQRVKDIQLSARTVASRVDMLSGNIQEQLDQDIAKLQLVSLVLDEFTDITGCAQLCILIRYVLENSIVKKELLDLVSLRNTTAGQGISGALIKVLKKHNVLRQNIFYCYRWSTFNVWKIQRSNCITKKNQPIV